MTLELINSQDANQIHDAVKAILWNVGVVVEYLPARPNLIHKHGCDEGDGDYIRLPPEPIELDIATVPKTILLYDIDENVKVDTSSRVSSCCSAHNCVPILEIRSVKLRPCLLDDIRVTARLCEQFPNIDTDCSLGFRSEIPP